MDWARVRRWLAETLRSLVRALEQLDGAGLAGTVARVSTITIGPADEPAVIVGPAELTLIGPEVAELIEPAPRAVWEEQGWTERRDGPSHVYEGEYLATRGSGEVVPFPGRIVVAGGTAIPYIADPPLQIKSHPKGPCFQLSHVPWFRVHWQRPATNVDDALLYVERILNEVLQ